MQFLAAFFEHFVVGMLAIICFSICYLNSTSPEQYIDSISSTEKIKELAAIVLLPTSYLIGIFVDALASMSGKTVKYLISKPSSTSSSNNSNNNSNPDDEFILMRIFKNLKNIKNLGGYVFDKSSYITTLKILKSEEISEELAKYFLQLNSRQKIARGVVFIMFSMFIYLLFKGLSTLLIWLFFLTFLSVVANLWHTHTLKNFKENFQ